jgi:hypothetical protein
MPHRAHEREKGRAFAARLAGLSLLFCCTIAAADDTPASGLTAIAVGVQVEKPAGDGVHYSQGSGVFLGNGMVLTAAHVVTIYPGKLAVTVLIDGVRVDGKLVFEESAGGHDLALIQLPQDQLGEARRHQPKLAVCPANPTPNQPVEVAEQGHVSRSATVNTAISSAAKMTDGWTNLLSTGYHHGSSGGGVFDIGHGCLWGIITLEMSGPSPPDGHFLDLTAFAPSLEINAFLQDYGRRAK